MISQKLLSSSRALHSLDSKVIFCVTSSASLKNYSLELICARSKLFSTLAEWSYKNLNNENSQWFYGTTKEVEPNTLIVNKQVLMWHIFFLEVHESQRRFLWEVKLVTWIFFMFELNSTSDKQYFWDKNRDQTKLCLTETNLCIFSLPDILVPPNVLSSAENSTSKRLGYDEARNGNRRLMFSVMKPLET